jgi:hypothetical protein
MNLLIFDSSRLGANWHHVTLKNELHRLSASSPYVVPCCSMLACRWHTQESNSRQAAVDRASHLSRDNLRAFSIALFSSAIAVGSAKGTEVPGTPVQTVVRVTEACKQRLCVNFIEHESDAQRALQGTSKQNRQLSNTPPRATPRQHKGEQHRQPLRHTKRLRLNLYTVLRPHANSCCSLCSLTLTGFAGFTALIASHVFCDV